MLLNQFQMEKQTWLVCKKPFMSDINSILERSFTTYSFNESIHISKRRLIYVSLSQITQTHKHLYCLKCIYLTNQNRPRCQDCGKVNSTFSKRSCSACNIWGYSSVGTRQCHDQIKKLKVYLSESMRWDLLYVKFSRMIQ